MGPSTTGSATLVSLLPSSALPFLLWLTLVLLSSQASGFSPNRHIRSVVDRLNDQSGPFVAMVMAYKVESDAVQSSGEFVANSYLPWVDLYGRRFHVGSIRGVPVISVMSGQRRLNAGITVQILLDYFDLRGIVHHGTAGSADDSLSFGDVSVPKYVAFTGSWNWMRFNSTGEEEFPDLRVGEYNSPMEGENLLGRIEFKPEEFFPVGGDMEEVFWLETSPPWFKVAHNLKDLKLEFCANSTYCLPTRPRVVLGLKGATADIFLDNAAYCKFLNNKFNVSTVDEESAAIVMAAKSPDIPVIVIRGVSDLAGRGLGWSSTTLSSLASTNALKVAIRFIELIGRKRLHHRLGVAIA